MQRQTPPREPSQTFKRIQAINRHSPFSSHLSSRPWTHQSVYEPQNTYSIGVDLSPVHPSKLKLF
ncbi:hypothetical protein RchiOBHm_Chr3g0475191 [Rosa chinensis]|uniref:Uncharacterized protein n=1 Tax=Rosa chinensis TaxID=74649 RepID=A0A2P6RCD2_ROSCH|nr:hypothetical protein RchiOBHm_Chr3g0475191 [Rosa chinensis]